MPIISFWNREKVETGKTFSLVAIATYMALRNNLKILIVSTQFNDKTIEECFWPVVKGNANLNPLITKTTDISTGIEGLSKAVMSNKSTPEIITNYTKVIFKDRLEVLLSPETTNYDEYSKIATSYQEIVQFANKYYDLVFVDVTNGLDAAPCSRELLTVSNLIIYTFPQKLKSINEIIDLKNEPEFRKNKNIIYMLSRTDVNSKYNDKNVARNIGERKGILSVPYCTLFGEAASEGNVAEYFIKYNKLTDETDQNYIFIETVRKDAQDIIYKLQELQMRY